MRVGLTIRSRRLFCLIFPLLLGAGCSSLKPIELPPEYTASPADSAVWGAVDAADAGNWHSLLNDGPSALDWRLKAIDTASNSVDLQTFLWFFDTAGAMVLDHIVRAADRNVTVRVVSDMSQHLHAEASAEDLTAMWRGLVESADRGAAILYADEPAKSNPKNREAAPILVANELITLFDDAKAAILIVAAYLIPTPDLEGAVQRALDRGVRLRILTNSIGSNNQLTAHSAYRNHIKTLLEGGVELHEVRTHARDRYMLTPIGRKKLEGDLQAENAWSLELQENGSVYWVSADRTLESQPATSFMQRIEDGFFSHLPIESAL